MKNLFNKNFSPCEKKSKAQTFPLAEKFATPPIHSPAKGAKNLLIKLLAKPKKFGSTAKGAKNLLIKLLAKPKSLAEAPKSLVL